MLCNSIDIYFKEWGVFNTSINNILKRLIIVIFIGGLNLVGVILVLLDFMPPFSWE